MRINNLWRISNNSKEKVTVKIFKVGDTARMSVLNGKKFHLDPGETKETDIGPEEVQIVFKNSSFRKHEEKVKTDRDIALSSEKEILFQDTAMFDRVDKAKDVEFISEAQANNMARQALVWGLGKIPQVGGVISGIVGFLWKEQKPKIDDLIEASEKRMKSWVHGQINDLQRDNLKKFAEGLLKNMEEYMSAKDPSSQLYWLRANISHFNKDMPFFTNKNYVPGTIDIGVEIATIHIGLLRERVIYADALGIPAADRSGHKRLLAEAIDDYQHFVLEVAIPAENRWREEAIESTDETGLANYRGYYLRDTVARQTYFYSDVVRGNSRNTSNSVVCKNYYLRQAKESYANALTANVGDTARMWTLLKESPETLKPIAPSRITWVGPSTGLIYKRGNEHGAVETLRLETKGEITEIIVRAHEQVDYLKFVYADGKSGAIGNANNGTQYSVKLAKGVYITKVETWWDWELVALRFHLSDGTVSGQFGNKSHMGHHYQVAVMPNHILTGMRIEGSNEAPIGNAISFGFCLQPDFYELPN